VVRLQESTEVKAQTNLSMLDVFEGASPDYAVVAQKAGHPNLKERLQGLFEQAFGISGHVLLERHRQQMLESRFHLEKTISNAQLRAQKAELLAQNAELLSAQLKARLDRLEEQGTQKNQMAYKGLLGWFIQQTLRVAEQGVWTRLKALVRKLLRIIGRPVVHFVNNRPHFKMQLINLAQKLGLLPLLRSVWNRMQISATQNSHQADHPAVTTDSMSQQAQRIAQTLQNKKRT
jgi:O-antigen chain-terminating methyltransferase